MKDPNVKRVCAAILVLTLGAILRGQVIVEFALESPGAVLQAGRESRFLVTARGMEVGIAEVQLFAGEDKLADAVQVGGQDWVAPRVIFPDAGEWEVTARATDENGQIWSSMPAIFEVEYAPPEVHLLAPLEGGRHPVGTILPVQVAAYDPFGLINTVELWLNDQLILSYAWNENNVGWVVEVSPDLLPNQVLPGEQPFRSGVQLLSAGTYRLEARAYSTTGLSGFSGERRIEVAEANSAPVLNVLYPLDGTQVLPGTTLPVQVEGHDPGGLIEQVEFLLNGVVVDQVTTPPFRTDIRLPSTGTYRLQARATTTMGAFAYSQEVLLLTGPPDGVTPRVIVDFPLPLGAGDTINDVSQASRMYFNATVQDPDEGSIQAVYFYLNGELVGEADSRLGDTWSLFHAPNTTGNYILTASALDADGRVGWSLPILLDVGPLERPLPSAFIEPPMEGILGREVVLRAVADGGLIPIDRVDFLAEGVYLGSVEVPDEDGSYRFGWTPPEAGDFNVQARVVQIDPDDSVWDTWVVTEPVVLTVMDPVGNLPAVSLLAAPEQSRLAVGSTVMLMAEAYDPEGEIERVEFYVDETLVGTVEGSPYSLPYDVIKSGRHVLRSRIVDADGNAVFSDSVEVEVLDRAVSNGARLELDLAEAIRLGDPVQLSVSLSGSVLLPSAVHYYANNQLIGIASQGEMAFEWVPPLVGDVDFFGAAVIELSGGARQTIVSPITRRQIAIGGPDGEVDMPPEIERFSANVAGRWARLGQTLVWEIEATDDDGLVSIEVFRNGEILPTDSILPIEVVDVIEEMGIFRYVARVRDTGGNVTESPVREIRATRGSPALVLFGPQHPGPVYTGGEAIELEAYAVMPEEPVGIPSGAVKQVEFFLNGELIGTSLHEPHRVTVDPAGILVGLNRLVAVAETDTGLRSRSEVVEIIGIEGSLPEIRRFTVNSTSRTELPGATLTFMVEAEDAEGIALVELLLFGERIAYTEADPFQFSLRADMVGSYRFSVRVTNFDGHAVESEAISIEVVHPDPLASDSDFVYQTFEDLLFRLPSDDELTAYGNALQSGLLTRERLVAGLLGAGERNAHTDEYEGIRAALLGMAFAAESWPTRAELSAALAEVRAGGLETVVARRMPTYAKAYLVETGRELPDILSGDEAVEAFVSWIFEKKYAMAPTADQLQLARWHFLALGRESYVSRFLVDNTIIALPTGGWATSQLGFRFASAGAPVSPLLHQLDGASLIINLLRSVPTSAEVESLAKELPVTRVATLVADIRYTNRFRATFAEIEVHRDGWLRSEWFGWFNREREPWVYHSEQGWVSLQTSGQSETNLWYYDPAFGWMWTQSRLYPYIFDSGGQRWLWNWRSPYVAGKRLFYDLRSQDWILR